MASPSPPKLFLKCDGLVEICLTGDGAEITGKHSGSQCAIGYKPTDEDAIDPLTGDRMYYEMVEHEGRMRKRYMNMQKCKNVAVAAISIKSESKELIKELFGDFFQFGTTMATEGLAASPLGRKLKPFRVLVCGDLCFLQKITGCGGACKVMHHFCCYCECHGNDDMFHFTVGEHRCKYCVYNNRDQCYHRAVNDPEEVARKESVLLDLIIQDQQFTRGQDDLVLADLMPLEPHDCLAGYSDGEKVWEKICLKETFNEDGTHQRATNDYLRQLKHTEEDAQVLSKSKMRSSPDQLNKSMATNNIEYKTGIDEQRDRQFFGNIRNDLLLRGYSTQNGTMPTSKPAMMSTITEIIRVRDMVSMYRNAINIEERAKGIRVAHPGLCIPCDLHGPNRTSEKLLKEMIAAGMRRLVVHQSVTLEQYIASVDACMNEEVLCRTAMHLFEHGRWTVPMNEKRDKLGDFTFRNEVAKRVIKNLHKLAEVCISPFYEAEIVDQWNLAVQKYMEMTEKLSSRFEFEFQDIASFQLSADEFYDAYFELTGRDGMTNYFHHYHAGHYCYFLEKYGNLYKYSQQGWENCNGVMKR